MSASTDRCTHCGQFIGPAGQWGAVAPSDQWGDPDYDAAVGICSIRCAEIMTERTGFDHWYAQEAAQ